MKKRASNVISVFIAVILVVVSVFTTFLYATGNVLSEENVHEQIEVLNTKQLVQSDVMEKKGALKNFKETINLLYEVANELSISDKVIDNTIESSIIKEIFYDVSSNLLIYLKTGDNNSIFSLSQFYQLVDNNLDNILKQSNIKLSKTDKDFLASIIKKEASNYIKKIPTSKVVFSQVKEKQLKQIRFILNPNLILWAILLCTILISFIIALNFKKGIWLRYLFVSFMISGLLNLLISFIIINKINTYSISTLFPRLVEIWENSIYMISECLFLLSILFIIFSIIYKMILLKTTYKK